MFGIVVAAMIAVSSQVTDVTVYNDRARVVRTAETELPPGLSTVVFADLPASIDSRSVQVDGAGQATVLDVRFKTENFEQIPDARWKELYDLKQTLTDDQKAVELRIARAQQAQQFLDQISVKVTHPAEEEGGPALEPAGWGEMLALYTQKMAEYDATIRTAELELRAVRLSLDKVLADISDAGAGKKKTRRVVEVDVEAATAGSVALNLAYLVRGPQWVPTYDIRVDTASRTMKLSYFAVVRQSTGEDWSNVNLLLSTANPGLGGQHPELDPWRIQIGQPVRLSKARMLSESSFGRVENSFESDVAYSKAESAPAPMAVRQTDVSRQGASVVFAVPGASTIDSDNVEHRVAVSAMELPAQFRYSAVPKLDPHAYLKAKGVNGGAHPLLEGTVNVFLDGSFVTTSTLELVAPDEEFWVFLGADESIKVEHKLIKKYESSEGLTGRGTRHTYDYLMTVKNTHAVAEEVVVWDQLPISGSEGLKVKLLEPKYTKDSETLKIDDQQRVEWIQTLTPGQEWTIPFSFYVEAPSDKRIDGLR